MYYRTGILGQFWSYFKNFVKNSIMIEISSNFLRNLKTCIYIRINYKNGEFSPFNFVKICQLTLYSIRVS